MIVVVVVVLQGETVFKMSLAAVFLRFCFLGKPPIQPFFTFSLPANLC